MNNYSLSVLDFQPIGNIEHPCFLIPSSLFIYMTEEAFAMC